MSVTWQGDAPPPDTRISLSGWARIAVRGAALIALLLGGLTMSLILRAIERPVCGMSRPITPWITVFVCRISLWIIGLKFETIGTPMTGRGAVVANHASWLDILVLNARRPVYFVSKSEVARWPGIGLLARTTGTVFIDRKRAKAAEQSAVFEHRLTVGHRLMFFPEGTSSDGLQVLPFKTSLFAAFFSPDLRDALSIQPVSVTYHAPVGADPRFYGWWGDMDLGPHLIKVLAAPRQGRVSVRFTPPLNVADFRDRKSLAASCEDQVRAGWTAHL